MKGVPFWMASSYFRLYSYVQKVHHFFIPFFKKKNTPKVFCIGDYKTGTNSIYKALKILGYRTTRLFNAHIYSKDKDKYLKKLVKSNYDAYSDYPFGKGNFYQELDKAIPNSKFILTVRDKDSFKKSYSNYFGGWSFKLPDGELAKRAQYSEDRNKEIINYFKSKSSQLLIIDITKGAGWKEICNFLNKPIPNKPFPHSNKGRYKK